jgi:hypothetical protein
MSETVLEAEAPAAHASVAQEFMDRYGPLAGAEGPVLFVEEVLGVEQIDDWQYTALRAHGAEERRVSIRACHGPGKTALAAWCITYNLIFRYPQKSVATAPSRGQLEGALVAEVHKWVGKLPDPVQALLDVKSTSINLLADPTRSYFQARTARAENPEALQGVHEDEGWVFLVADEASGVHEKIFEAAAGSMSGHHCQTLLLSNPVRTSGFFYDTHHKLKDMWLTIHISHEDSARVTDDFVEDMARRYGADSNAFRVRALGEFPLSDLDTIIPAGFVAAARTRDIVVHQGASCIWGVDVARFGDDVNSLLKRTSVAVLPDIAEWGGVDLMQTAGRVKNEFDACRPHERPEEILIDVIGLGAGVVDRLQEQGLPVRGINVSETASHDEQYRNLRTELWFKGREWLMKMGSSLPSCEGGCERDCIHEKLARELVSLKYTYASTGKLVAESKAEMKKRGLKSPNIAEAFILSFASEPAGMVHGSSDGFGSGWNQDVSRNRSMV